MARRPRSKTRCLLIAPLVNFVSLRETVKAVATASGVQISTIEDLSSTPALVGELIFSEILRSDLIIAILTGTSPTVLYEIGLAQASGKPVVFLVERDARIAFPLTGAAQTIHYEDSREGMQRLSSRLRKIFYDFRNEPNRFKSFYRLPSQAGNLPIVDLDRL